MLKGLLGIGIGAGFTLLGVIAYYAKENAKNTKEIKKFVKQIDLDRLDDIVSEVEQIDLERLDNLVEIVEDSFNINALKGVNVEKKINTENEEKDHCNLCSRVYPDCREKEESRNMGVRIFPVNDTEKEEEDIDFSYDEEEYEDDECYEDDKIDLRENLFLIKELLKERDNYTNFKFISKLKHLVEEIVEELEWSSSSVLSLVGKIIDEDILTKQEVIKVCKILVFDEELSIASYTNHELKSRLGVFVSGEEE